MVTFMFLSSGPTRVIGLVVLVMWSHTWCSIVPLSYEHPSGVGRWLPAVLCAVTF